MDNKVQILLGSKKNINSVNTDSYTKIELVRNASEINEFTVNDVVSSTEVFDEERSANQVYRIYGRIEWLSLLNGLRDGYDSLEDFFNPQSTDSKKLQDVFQFYLVAPSSAATYGTIYNTDLVKRNFEVIAGKDDIEIYNAGFSNNVYGEQTYAFNFSTDIDVSNYYDKLGFPLTEIYLYAQYIKTSTEEMSRSIWDSAGAKSMDNLTTKDLVVGDVVENLQGDNIQDVIEYDEENYSQEQVDYQTFYIRTPYVDGTTKWLEWSYNPFIPMKLRYLDSTVSEAKAAEIVESTTTLDVYATGNTSIKINTTKTEPQTLRTSAYHIKDWNTVPSTPNYGWNASAGELFFTIPAGFTYDITFTTQIYLPNGSDKYVAEIWLEDNTRYVWAEVPNTRRRFLITNSIQTIHLTKSYGLGEVIRFRTRLIPNPDKRKIFEIPDYAKLIYSKGKWVWREILPQGYVDPLTGDGVDYPFFNKRRYLFEPIVFDVLPNLSEETGFSHNNTLDVFSEISYYKNATSIDNTPLTELDDIEKPCQ